MAAIGLLNRFEKLCRSIMFNLFKPIRIKCNKKDIMDIEIITFSLFFLMLSDKNKLYKTSIFFIFLIFLKLYIKRNEL